MRAFVAVDVSARIRAGVAEQLVRLRARSPDARWVRVEAIHVTLSFLGEIPDSEAPGLATALEALASRHRPFTLRVRGGGAFGAPARPKVLWAGIDGDLDALRALRDDVEAAVAPVLARRPGPSVEKHEGFSPHLTLARARHPRGDPALVGCVSMLAAAELGELPVQEVVLFRSDSAPGGMRHTALLRAPLLLAR